MNDGELAGLLACWLAGLLDPLLALACSSTWMDAHANALEQCQPASQHHQHPPTDTGTPSPHSLVVACARVACPRSRPQQSPILTCRVWSYLHRPQVASELLRRPPVAPASPACRQFMRDSTHRMFHCRRDSLVESACSSCRTVRNAEP